MSAETGPSGITGMYESRDFAKGPTTYTSVDFFRKIAEATGLNKIQHSVRVLDAMSGPGHVGKGLQKIAPHHRYFYLDLAEGQLARIENAQGRVVADARQMPFVGGTFQVGVVRYAAKDIPKDQQLELFKQMHQITTDKGRLVLADMYSPIGDTSLEGDEIYDWLNWQHALKQEKGGRNPQNEGRCHIPTETGWLNLLNRAGFDAVVSDHHTSFVTTTEWVEGNQIPASELEKINQAILNAPSGAIRAFNIRKEGEEVKVNFPVTIIRAIKL